MSVPAAQAMGLRHVATVSVDRLELRVRCRRVAGLFALVCVVVTLAIWHNRQVLRANTPLLVATTGLGFMVGLYGHEALHALLYRVHHVQPHVDWRLSHLQCVGGAHAIPRRGYYLIVGCPGVALTFGSLVLMLYGPSSAQGFAAGALFTNVVGSVPDGAIFVAVLRAARGSHIEDLDTSVEIWD